MYHPYLVHRDRESTDIPTLSVLLPRNNRSYASSGEGDAMKRGRGDCLEKKLLVLEPNICFFVGRNGIFQARSRWRVGLDE